MQGSVPLIDLVILMAGIALILLTSIRVSRRRPGRKPVKSQTGTLFGIAVWLGFLGVAIYLIFG